MNRAPQRTMSKGSPTFTDKDLIEDYEEEEEEIFQFEAPQWVDLIEDVELTTKGVQLEG
jgi:hypothetical protein